MYDLSMHVKLDKAPNNNNATSRIDEKSLKNIEHNSNIM